MKPIILADRTPSPFFSYGATGIPGTSASLGSSKTFTDISCLVAVNQTSTVPSGFDVIVSNVEDYTQFYFGPSQGGLRLVLETNELDGRYYNAAGQGWMIFGFTATSGLQNIFVNNCLVAHGTATLSSFSTSALQFSGITNGGNFQSLPFPGSIGSFRLFDRYLTSSEYLEVFKSMQIEMGISGIPLIRPKAYYTASGDSLTNNSESYAFQILSNDAAFLSGGIFATSGVDIATLSANLQAYQLSPISNVSAVGSNVIFSVLTGANDPNISSDPTSFYNSLVALYDSVTNVGGKVLAITVLPKDSNSFNTGRGTVNSLLRANPSHYSALADLDTTAAGQDAAPFSTTYYSDGVHLTQAGYNLVNPVINSTFDSIRATL